MPTKTREIHLAARPTGWPTPDDFRLVETELPDPGPGEVLVRNTVMSVDPYMRGRMNDMKSYVPPYRLGEVLDGGAVGTVVASNDDSLAVGDTVLHQLGWREHALAPAASFRRVDTSGVEESAYLGVLGMPGLTAYVGLTAIAGLREGDRVLISGAAGAVGSTAGQVARLLGASAVVGSAGSAEKVAWLTDDLGFNAAVNYRDGSPLKLLEPHGPFDVYFDNVGGEHLEAAIALLSDHGRIAACGSIASYNDELPTPGPRNMFQVVTKRLRMQGFIVTDHGDVAREYQQLARQWVADGKLVSRETVVDGLDHAVDAFLGLHRGENLGKMLVRL
ncbi:NADP-dependent oxidoreductase [Nocardioides ochotonae]|uniref:NADP-dependent oxidoreductase n=1 Tax=Nocardioides ochotonae TaxID=2685869 RepID=UPI00140D4D53|nr:NADP-dependent oxidoreductase [Nocardioides ochotonae]